MIFDFLKYCLGGKDNMSKYGGWDGPTLLITCDFLGGLEKKMYFCDCKLDV